MLQYPQPLPPLALKSQRPSVNPRRRDLRKEPLAIPPALPQDSPRSPYISSRPLPLQSPRVRSQALSIASASLTDVLFKGDVVGDGFYLQGEQIRTVSNAAAHHSEPAAEFEVIKQLGTGSYAVVYLVQEVLSRPPPSDDGHMSIASMDFEGPKEVVYGRKYAIKCLSKANLDEEALAVQMSEVTIHQSLHIHPNIVTLYRTLETSSFLLLLLEYVPGEDLFYFLEQARDHYDLDPTDSSVSPTNTPPTPSLLSNLNPSRLLSRTRLRLISSMFSQMCDAVAACHAQGVYHRDIKPENFIVTDGYMNTLDGRSERKVIVKLTDFGLSTTDVESADMDCGSAPYMSYECRNNVAPTYRPRAADVWSLGIVLINMLYHFNPWTDTAQGACSSFDVYLKDPVNFFMTRFMGMTRPVADVLANKVFCILQDPHDDSPRMGAAEFGAWSRNLPTLLGGHGVHRTVSSGSTTQGHRISLSIPLSHRPSSRHPSGCTTAARNTPAMPTRTLSRAPSLEPPYEREQLSTVIDQDNEDDAEDGDLEIEGMTSRSTSTNKRRKRGARKGKGAVPTSPMQDDTLDTVADAAQSLAREISMASKSSSHRSGSAARARKPFEPVSMYPVPAALLSRAAAAPASAPTATVAPTATHAAPPAPVTKKPSKWRLSFSKNSGAAALAASSAAAAAGRISPVQEVSPPTSLDLSPAKAMASTASNVASLLMGLNAPPPQAPMSSHMFVQPNAAASSSSFSLSMVDSDAASTWSRGRRGVRDPSPLGPHGSARQPTSRSPGYALSAAGPHARSLHSLHHPPLPPQPLPGVPSVEPWATSYSRSDRAVSPNSTRSGATGGGERGGAGRGAAVSSSASSVVSANWRSSMSTSSSAGTSTSAFTRYSNSSARSVSTTATSVSSASWRTSVKPGSTFSGQTGYSQGNIPKNIKIMDGVPWELDQLPRGQHPNPVGDIFGSPPVRKQRTRKPKDLKLDTINERPSGGAVHAGVGTGNNGSGGPHSHTSQHHQQQHQNGTAGAYSHAQQKGSSATPPSVHMRRDAATSTTDLSGLKDDGEGKKVNKTQINALAKLLSAMRR
ncbi:Pkinase-domain-containing protein [Pholiota conissans]|uniref:Pkinase-domain-containing protein n=1 Tax=Pholiota conissans TaxID=109636 RepID=A0A9P6CV83_9AGAR|nr:Pkinase-domain-containing protein [Pholiota conissans]